MESTLLQKISRIITPPSEELFWRIFSHQRSILFSMVSIIDVTIKIGELTANVPMNEYTSICQLKHKIGYILQTETRHHQVVISGEVVGDMECLSAYIRPGLRQLTVELRECLLCFDILLLVL